MLDAVVIGAGPNGLAAAATLARAGRSVLVVEANPTIGGGARTDELTLPGVRHDSCSAVHPFGKASPVFRDLGLDRYGLRWLEPEVALAHPLDDGSAAVLSRSVAETAASLGADGPAWGDLVDPLVNRWDALVAGLLSPVIPPRRPLAMSLFARHGIRSAVALATSRFAGERPRALLAGLAAHSVAPLTQPLTAGIALLFAVAAHGSGWPLPAGGSQAISDALAAVVTEHGGTIRTGEPVRSLAQLPASRVVLADVTPRQLAALAGAALPPRWHRRMTRFRYGPGVCKVDYVLRGPVPWAAEACRRAGTVHVGGTLHEIVRSEADAVHGRVSDAPFVLVAQPSLVDPSRAPDGLQVLWAYCHVPHASDADVSEAIDRQIERFAPGFRDLVVARAVRTTAQVEAANANCVGGDVAAGAMTGLRSVLRPWPALNPYATGLDGVYLCSASTPPGAGVHGMCGHRAARLALRRELR